MRPLSNNDPEIWNELFNNCHETWNQNHLFARNHGYIYKEWFTGRLVHAKKKPHFWYCKASFKEIVQNLYLTTCEHFVIKDLEKTKRILMEMTKLKEKHVYGYFFKFRQSLSRIQNRLSCGWQHGSKTALEIVPLILEKIDQVAQQQKVKPQIIATAIPAKEVQEMTVQPPEEEQINPSEPFSTEISQKSNIEDNPPPQVVPLIHHVNLEKCDLKPSTAPLIEIQAQDTSKPLEIQAKDTPNLPTPPVEFQAKDTPKPPTPPVEIHAQDTPKPPAPPIEIQAKHTLKSPTPPVEIHARDTSKPPAEPAKMQAIDTQKLPIPLVEIQIKDTPKPPAQLTEMQAKDNQPPTQPLEIQEKENPKPVAQLAVVQAQNYPKLPSKEPTQSSHQFVKKLQELNQNPVREYLSKKLAYNKKKESPSIPPKDLNPYYKPEKLYPKLNTLLQKPLTTSNLSEAISDVLNKLSKTHTDENDLYTTSQREMALRLAAGKGYLEVVKVLVELGAKNEHRDYINQKLKLTSALHEAVKTKRHKVMHYLLANGANPAESYENNPLITLMTNPILYDAIIRNDLLSVKLLLAYFPPEIKVFEIKQECFFDSNVVKKRTVLDMARRADALDVFKYFLSLKDAQQAFNNGWESTLFKSVSSGSLRMIEFILFERKELSMDYLNTKGFMKNVVYNIIDRNHRLDRRFLVLIPKLIQQGADITAPSPKGTPLKYFQKIYPCWKRNFPELIPFFKGLKNLVRVDNELQKVKAVTRIPTVVEDIISSYLFDEIK